MKGIKSSRMKAIDENCEHLGLKGLQLMENAGAAIAHEVRERVQKGNVLIVAGRGNNGGDAFVAARHLAYDPAITINIALIGSASQIRSEDAINNYGLLEHCRINALIEITDPQKLKEMGWLDNADIIVDALLGTGITGKLKETEATIIDLINDSNVPVIAVDVPSGFDPDGGEFERSVRADVTLTFHRMKKGLVSGHAKEYTSEVKVINIGVCEDAEKYVGEGDINAFRTRHGDSHKGQHGKILIIGGGPYSGAPALTAMAALRAGADIVTVAAPANVADIIASFSPNIIVKALSSNILCKEDMGTITKLIESHDVVVIGMGLGRAEQTKDTVSKIIPLCTKVVADADALYGIDLPVPKGIEMIITPHAGEYNALGGNGKEDTLEFSKRNNVTILLKGREDHISNGKRIAINRNGNPGMTVGGTGDVLAGIAGALFATACKMDAACGAAYINGAAGDLAFERMGSGLLATDIIDMITEVMK
ncbi:bifunctional ADP-dependent NAD(P)H-hydrate dehydratase/NAD(P)H-hydrate epimerase [Methanococcoides burtonii]|uniref:Bifunctional NAD(P)H-hydrate repair enzyme n=1 Tax=Methanococcoides burtonii (strain DSM 6242 / NBRC 107633 / OCM 468 / ACE-M) TaxID=259564 RepID=Q12UW3_METBU|nr:bifunctional ADP-dependent NAD(P)H-hydrate dehydratase/NAD(P)H-hydrate epimerase [Methanococcoides burtonii]ABE52763.1 YjeF-related hypothetical protein [Methanococcoides burtonii DSM 6242]